MKSKHQIKPSVICYPAEKMHRLLAPTADKTKWLGFDGRLRNLPLWQQQFSAISALEQIIINLVARRARKSGSQVLNVLVKANSLWPCLRLHTAKTFKQFSVKQAVEREHYTTWMLRWQEFVALLRQFKVQLLVVDNKHGLTGGMLRHCASISAIQDGTFKKQIRVIKRGNHTIKAPPKRGLWTTRQPFEKAVLIKTGGYFIDPL